MTIAELEQKFKDRPPALMEVKQHFAVLVPLVEHNGAPHILFEVRSRMLDRQPGEVCFPGGHVEEGERPEECAVRETFEELGIPAQAIHPIAWWDRLMIPRGLVHPLMARVDADAVAAMRPNPAEVEETFLVPLDFFVETEPKVYTLPLVRDVSTPSFYEEIGFPRNYHWRRREEVVPVWRYQGHVIWGMTGKLLMWHLHRQW